MMITERGTQFYIGGEWQEHADATSLPVVDPASERVIGHIAAGEANHADLAVAAARKAFPAFSQSSVPERLELLGRVHSLLKERAELFAEALVMEMGAAISFARASQVPFAAEHIRVQMEVLENYRFVTVDGRTATAKEAIGVCALITPWNWPLYQITAKLAPAIAAGCTVVLKPSELSPYSALLFAELMHDAGTPPGVFNLVNGTGESVGAALSSHPDVDMISITGSTRAGVLVAQAAAPTVKRVVQELGGKSPNILLDDADFAEAVPKGVLAGMRNVGQSCSAPTRMLVPAHRLAEVEALAGKTARAIRVGDPRDSETAMGPIANRAQYERVQAMIRAGIDEGAKLLCGGLGRPAGLDRGFFTQPTIFSEVRPDMRIAREEIFGPVLVIIPYRDEEEAIAIANDTVYGLGAHVQSSDPDRARRVASRIRAGQVHINYPAWDGTAAFGGYKRSGNGREYGMHGLEEYLETKAILGY
ncbi:aldehyde dehydrogenase [Sinorhizobium fredii USDA 205]|uniref:Aldehyde dehydrogenase family protein n=2 Tax=Rhizobium fredii TaxID=380 RepID=A0A844AIE9_RHIFR|nr:Aldehyde dehydrogenase [Sinorhizobium fredii CCBAU 25509]KSV80794.1 aldehyde dehydrogenase [Sinorhizobium fredii USDA 205]MQW96992.1 aldehyde dehydrogenase family protein [Sinorhizobium fredii]MQX11605.1 aldehyde dehydrogenase family protein [Sinorhizobium fredii]GEC35146.1 aldehyde dehydrogenase [Sinorhizobium fredii]